MSTAPDPKLRVAVAGLSMGAELVETLATHPRAEVRAFCDLLEARTSPLPDRNGVPRVYTDFEAMLAEEELDGVCISPPNLLHGPMAQTALARALHVFCEKPLTLDTAEARALLEQARARGLTHG